MMAIDRPPVLTLDGPAGSGKGTVALHLAAKLGWHILDSGAIYRLVAFEALRQGLALDDEKSLVKLAKTLTIAFQAVNLSRLEILLAGQPLGDSLRSAAIGEAASQVAVLPQLRQALLAVQRAFLQPPGLIADGRDMATVVFPEAPYQVFLTASLACRAERRFKQLKDQNVNVTLPEVFNELEKRDKRDANRAVAPLQIAPHAFILDTSDLSVEDVVDRILLLLKQ
jgi:cytidylate kinase